MIYTVSVMQGVSITLLIIYSIGLLCNLSHKTFCNSLNCSSSILLTELRKDFVYKITYNKENLHAIAIIKALYNLNQINANMRHHHLRKVHNLWWPHQHFCFEIIVVFLWSSLSNVHFTNVQHNMR